VQMTYLHLSAGAGGAIWLPGLALVGLCIGFVAGMFGVGGGFMLMPMLIYLFGVPADIAVGSAICQQCGTALSAFLKYRALKRGDPRIDLIMMGGSLAGVDAGARIMAHLSTLASYPSAHGHAIPAAHAILDICFVLLLGCTSLFVVKDALNARKRLVPRGDLTIPGPFITRVRIPPFIDLPGVQLKQVSVPMIAVTGFALGTASGMLGLGGGVLLVPVLMYGFGISLRNAAGTGVLLLFVTVAAGTVEYTARGRVNLPLAMAILMGSSIGAQLGALTTNRLPNRQLRLIFAGLLVVTILLIVWDLVRLLNS
jgi:uncharacterized protein